MKKSAIFAAGCFWGVEHSFKQLDGVLSTEVGYSGGHSKEPTYQQVCRGDTGHAEAVKVDFENSKTSFDRLLDHFWQMHDPTQKNRQGPDIGHQYRSAVFCLDEEQLVSARLARSRQQEKLGVEIATEVVAAGPFWPAEEYHQDYFEKNAQAACKLQLD